MSKHQLSIGTEQNEKDLQLDQLLAEYRTQKGALIPVLQKAQDIYGYLPENALQKIAQELNHFPRSMV